MGPADVLLLTQDKEVAAAVHEVLETGSVHGTASVCRNLPELKTRLANPPDGIEGSVAVVDIDIEPQRILFELGRVVAVNPNTRFVVVSKEFDERLILQAMQAGARHFLRKSAISAELSTVLERLLAHGAETSRQLGEVISVFGCSGGCGATLAAINLANELRLATAKPVLIVDLDNHYGSVATYLGIGGKYGIAHVLNREGTIDRDLIESSTVSVAPGFDVLLSPAVAQSDAGLPMNYDNLLRVLDVCRESHRYVFVDAPRVPRQVTADLASVSRLAVLVLQLTVRDVAFARSLVAFLAERGMARDKILALANRVRRRGPLLRVVDTQRAIGIKPLYRVRSDWQKALKSVNQGQPLANIARRSGLRRDLCKIAAQVQRWTSNGDR
jgi:pilus assembly protein CpaE